MIFMSLQSELKDVLFYFSELILQWLKMWTIFALIKSQGLLIVFLKSYNLRVKSFWIGKHVSDVDSLCLWVHIFIINMFVLIIDTNNLLFVPG